MTFQFTFYSRIPVLPVTAGNNSNYAKLERNVAIITIAAFLLKRASNQRRGNLLDETALFEECKSEIGDASPSRANTEADAERATRDFFLTRDDTALERSMPRIDRFSERLAKTLVRRLHYSLLHYARAGVTRPMCSIRCRGIRGIFRDSKRARCIFHR